MKLFRETGVIKEFSWESPVYDINEYGDIPVPTEETRISKEIEIILEIMPETEQYLLSEKRGSTISSIRHLIVYLYNFNAFPNLDLFSLMCRADDEHAELIVNIIDSCSLKYGGSCFLLINELAPKIIDTFYSNEE